MTASTGSSTANSAGLSTSANRSPSPTGRTRRRSAAARRAPSAVDGHELLREPGQHLAAAVGHDDQVLDADAELARQVDPGLDRHRVAGLQRALRGLRQPRRLVHLQPDPVAEAVPEAIAEPAPR